MALEIDRLQSLLTEAEARLKIEVSRLKKKYQLMITELEMSLDVANKQNIDFQKTIKKQGLQIVVSIKKITFHIIKSYGIFFSAQLTMMRVCTSNIITKNMM